MPCRQHWVAFQLTVVNLPGVLASCASFCHCRPLKSLQPPDNHCLHAAIGWLELGNHTEANEELEKISHGLRAHLDVLEVRLEIYAKAKKWAMCVDIAGAIIKLDPTRPDAWIQRSFALHGMKQPQMALDQLLP